MNHEPETVKLTLPGTLDGMERTILYLQGQVDGARKALGNHAEMMRHLILFLNSFEAVFGAPDWDFTKERLESHVPDYVIAESGTFLDPRVEDESNNWANRGSLLAAYRALRECLIEEATP